MNERSIEIGLSIPRADALGKVNGTELFATDYYPAGLLWVGVRYSDHAHARVVEIKTAAAKSMPGIVAVLTAADIKGSNRIGIVEADQPVLADERVCCTSDPLAIVLAERREQLGAAVKAITVEYELLPGLFDPEQARLESAPVIHPGRRDGNILLSGRIDRGDLNRAWEECFQVVESSFATGWQEHSYLETENGVAQLMENGVVEIIASTQTPFRDRMELARAFNMPFDMIRIKAPYLGGGFGGKDGINVQGLLLLAALHSAGRPVKIWNNREESIRSSTKRHPARLHFKLGAREDGTLHALQASVVLDTGAYAHLGGQVLVLAIEHLAGVYRIPNTSLEGWAVYTNNPVGGAFRGFGAPQALGAMEQMMDILAGELGRDPLELRLQNAVGKGDEMGSGALVSNSAGIYECLEKIQKHRWWTGREQWESQSPPFIRRATGIAAGMQGIGYGPVVQDGAGAKIELTAQGKFRIYCGISDMGQGNNPTNLQFAGTILGQNYENMELILPDTGRTLPSGSAAASRTTFTYANALIKACGLIRDNILKRACMMVLGSRVEEMTLLPGRVRHLPSGREMSLQMLAAVLDDSEKLVSSYHIAQVARHNPAMNDSLKLAGIPHRVFAFNAHLVRLEIDERTGRIVICDYLAVTDGGQVINPMLFEQQIQGGIAQGIGYALYENLVVTEGQIKNADLASYTIPGAQDVPEMESIAVQTYEEDGPFGMKGIGEISINLPLPAISNGVARALRRRITSYPLNAEKVLNTLLEGGR